MQIFLFVKGNLKMTLVFLQMDMDIISIDQKIQNILKTEEDKLDKYKETLSDIERLLLNKNLEICTKNKLVRSKQDYIAKIKELEDNHAYNFYITETMPIIQRYKDILKKPVRMSFLSKKGPEKNEEKESIIREFLTIAKKYTNIEQEEVDVESRKEMCDHCHEKNLVYSENVLICLCCGYEFEVGNNPLSYKDISRTNILQKYTYERRSHFRDCINQFQGKQNCKIPPEVYTDLEEQFKKHNLLVGDENTRKEERFSKVKKEHVMLFLRELKYDKQYENINYIYSQLTGAKCYDISHLEEQLMADFDTLVNLYIKKFKYEKKIARKSFMNINYVFYQLLNKNKYHCKKEEFNILKTIDRKTFHDDVFKELFEELGWNHVPFF